MLVYSWFADAYNWPPQVVRELELDELEWLPIIRQARNMTQNMIQEAEQRESEARSRRRG